MTGDGLDPLIGDWELTADLPGAEDMRGLVTFERFGPLLLQRSTAPDPVPDSICLIAPHADGGYTQHYFDSRGVVRLYAMTFDGQTWTLERTEPDFSPLDFHQRYIGTLADDGSVITGEWQASDDGTTWQRDFRLSHRRAG